MAQSLTYEELEARVRELESRYTALQGLGMSKDGEVNFFKLTDKAHDAIVICNSEGKYIYANESAAKNLGYSVSEFLTKSYRDLAHPDDLEMVSKNFKDRIEGKVLPKIYEARFIRKDGTTVYIEVSGTRLLRNGESFALIIARDVTGRKKVKKTLSEREALLQGILESTADGIIVIGEDQRVITCNLLFEEMWKIPKKILEEGDNEKIRDLVFRQIELPQEVLSQTLNAYGTDEETLHTLFLKDGRIFERRSRPLIVDGAIEGRVWNFHDSTEMEWSKLALLEAKRKYRDIVENAVEGVFQTTPEGQAVMANKALVTMLGYDSFDDIMDSISDIGQQVYERPEDRRAVMEQIEKKGFVKGVEVRLKRKDGRIIWASMNFRRVVDDNGTHVLNEGTVKDITARKEIEENLIQSETRYRNIFENAGIAMAVIENDETITDVNAELEKLTGYAREEIIGEKIRDDATIPEEAKRLREAHCEGSWGSAPRRYETVLVTKNRDKRDVVMTAFPIPGSSRQILSLLDISDRTTADKRIRESEETFRSHFENLGDMMFSMDRNLRITSVSPSIEEMLGYRPEEFIGKDFHEVQKMMSPKGYKISSLNAKRLLRGKQIELSEYELKAKDGRNVSVEISGNPLMKDGNVVGTISVVRNISKRKAAEALLRESEERYKYIVQHAPAGIYEVDYEKERFVSVNDVLCHYLGYTRDELLAIKPFDLFPEESREHLNERFAKLQLAEKVSDTVEYIVKTKSGEKIWILLTSRYRYEKGMLKGSTAVVYNITERKEMEMLLQENEERLRTVLEKMPVMLVSFDRSGNIIGWNAECEKMTGYSLEEVKESKTTWKMFFPEEKYRQWVLSKLSEFKNYFYNFEIRLVSKDGSLKTVSWSNISTHYPVPGWHSWGAGIDVTEIKEAHKVLEGANVKLEDLIEKKTGELNKKADRLDELNSALKVLVSAREDYKRELEENIIANFEQLIRPHLDVLKKSQLNHTQRDYFGILESHMNEITSPFGRDLSSRNYNLTPQEVKVAGLIKDHRTTKEIARLLHVSQSAVIFHRHNIRKKLGLIDKKVNLESYLRSFL